LKNTKNYLINAEVNRKSVVEVISMIIQLHIAKLHKTNSTDIIVQHLESSKPHFMSNPSVSAFSASTSIFDSSPLVSEFTWDIRVFVDPAMVLAQLGCSEYMTQLREQEIDMHAFLLLDEHNLKDIGVSTIGARKKIHHAIIKLRESARTHGYAI
uniref:SAM domain-containing protein n=1 Tax=Angiostrongylus cantonensis TaxID=6313 RepID=A0A0K0DN68_ANGCA